jgi:hypothetical protein
MKANLLRLAKGNNRTLSSLIRGILDEHIQKEIRRTQEQNAPVEVDHDAHAVNNLLVGGLTVTLVVLFFSLLLFFI